MGKRKRYSPAPEVAAIAARLIDLFHPHLRGVRIEYVFVSEAPRHGGRPVNGLMRVVTGLYAFLATPDFEGEPEPFFCMEITRPIWDVKPAEWRVALVDHELSHAGYDDEYDTICTVPHDELRRETFARRGCGLKVSRSGSEREAGTRAAIAAGLCRGGPCHPHPSVDCRPYTPP